jgi:aspartyl protease family protein
MRSALRAAAGAACVAGRGPRAARAALLAVLGVVACAAASAQTVTFNGRMGDKALLVIDGQPRTVALGATVLGVHLIGFQGDDAQVEFGGRKASLLQGAPVNLGGSGDGGNGHEIVLPAGPGGHFLATGSINGHAAQFMVDTGATLVAIDRQQADAMGLQYRNHPHGIVMTANGAAPAYQVTLDSVRIGDVQVYDVDAVVIPGSMGRVLLGNSFLSRFQMRRDNDVMRLEKR